MRYTAPGFGFYGGWGCDWRVEIFNLWSLKSSAMVSVLECGFEDACNKVNEKVKILITMLFCGVWGVKNRV